MFFLRQCWTCYGLLDFVPDHRVLVEVLGPGPPAEHCRQDLKVDWIRLAKLGLSETIEDFEGYILFSFIFPGKIAIWGCTRARWNCSQLPFAGGDARARCSGPCVAQIPSGGETDLGGVIKIHQTHQTSGNSLFSWGFSMVFKGEIWGTHPTNWRIFSWTQEGFSRGAIIPESFSSSSCGAGFPPMVCRQHVWWVAKAAVYRHLAKWNHFYAAFAPFLCPKMSEHCK